MDMMLMGMLIEFGLVSRLLILKGENKMCIDDLTFAELKQITALFGDKSGDKSGGKEMVPFEIGEKYMVRCIPFYFVGKVKNIAGKFVELEDASWVADSGDWEKALRSGKLDRVESYPFGVSFNIDAICDISPWKHSLDFKET